MTGVVPQKGFKMKLSINQGPYVGRTDYGFVVSAEHCKKLVADLLGWKESLPPQVACHIDVITVNPTTRVNSVPVVLIKIILSGGGAIPWKTEFERVESYRDRDGVSVSVNDLTNNLQRILRYELEKYQPLVHELGAMIDTLKVHY